MADDGNERLRMLLSPLESVQNPEPLLQLSVDFLVNTSNVNYQESLSEIAGQFGLAAVELKGLAQGLIVFFTEALHHGTLSGDFVRKRAHQLGVGDRQTQQLVAVWELSQNKISHHLVSKIIAKNRLVDLDWSFGVTASSEELDHIGKTFLQLKLTVDCEKEGLKTHFIEMSIEQFYHFLASLEKCRTFLDFVSPR